MTILGGPALLGAALRLADTMARPRRRGEWRDDRGPCSPLPAPECLWLDYQRDQAEAREGDRGAWAVFQAYQLRRERWMAALMVRAGVEGAALTVRMRGDEVGAQAARPTGVGESDGTGTGEEADHG